MSKLPKQLKIDKLLSSASNSPSTTPTRSRSPSASSELPPKKKAAPELKSESQNPSTSKAGATQLIEDIKNKRTSLFKSIDEFRFNKKRVRVLTETTTFPEDSQGILYWMSREQRVQGKFWAVSENLKITRGTF
jgi:hypothetical protein